LPIKFTAAEWESPHVKTHLLYQAHFCGMKLPVDYITDQRSIIESCIRIIQVLFKSIINLIDYAYYNCQAMFDFCLELSLLDSALNVIVLLQQVFQAHWYSDHPLLCLPHLSAHSIDGIG
jgi:hypothetical protein